VVEKAMTESDVNKIREEFPALSQRIFGKKLVYLDNGATTQKPKCVIDTINKFYTTNNANIHRGVHHLSQLATDQYEKARATIQNFVNASFPEEIIFTSGTTSGINLLASSFGEQLCQGDEIIISALEHHSNIVPWQMLCERKSCKLKVIPINERGELIMDAFDALLNEKTKLVSISHISNTLGTINPVKNIIKKAHAKGAVVHIDGAQSIQHISVDVKDLDCDFYTFSGHKVFGPTGVGVLYGKKALLNNMPPYQGGGDMIKKVTFEKTTYNILPHKFEAGTPHIAGGIGLGKAIEYLSGLNMSAIQEYERGLSEYAESKLLQIEGLRLIGTAKNKTSVVSFVVEGVHHFDLGTLMDKQGVAVRTGHHCTQPIMDFYGITGTVRASFAFYNTRHEVDLLVKAVEHSIKMLK
jgi:cysteine desulfurase/selenocysteine lyase